YKEFYEAYPGEKRKTWREYYTYGGLPRVLQLDTHEEKSLYLQRLLDETYMKDVIDRNRIRNDKKVLDDLLNVVASNIGGLTNPSKLSNTFGTLQHVNVNHTTISNYLDCFEDAYLIEKAQRYDVKGKKYLSADAKYYFTDLGLRNAKINFRQIEINHIMENIVYNELRNRGYSVDIGVVPTYTAGTSGKRERRDLEVDFICRKIDQTVYVQSALTLESEGKKEQESKSLINIRDGFKKVLITGDNVIPHYDENGFYIINIEDFLLDNNSLKK
ncbi:MAG: ATP-binding protein, partial [Erysipelotrichaceae bacterium]|nr:ATP-binding protein [Erysipelotrichaceae bacterium]